MSNDYNDFNRKLIADLRANRGKATMAPFNGGSLMILTTKGAKSGEPREHPLAYSREGEHHVVVASMGGGPKNPAWFHNLKKHPVVTVEVEGDKFEAKANVVEDEGEYERLFALHASDKPAFHEYRKKTARRMPVIVLERIDEDAA